MADSGSNSSSDSLEIIEVPNKRPREVVQQAKSQILRCIFPDASGNLHAQSSEEISSQELNSQDEYSQNEFSEDEYLPNKSSQDERPHNKSVINDPLQGALSDQRPESFDDDESSISSSFEESLNEESLNEESLNEESLNEESPNEESIHSDESDKQVFSKNNGSHVVSLWQNNPDTEHPVTSASTIHKDVESNHIEKAIGHIDDDRINEFSLNDLYSKTENTNKRDRDLMQGSSDLVQQNAFSSGANVIQNDNVDPNENIQKELRYSMSDLIDVSKSKSKFIGESPTIGIMSDITRDNMDFSIETNENGNEGSHDEFDYYLYNQEIYEDTFSELEETCPPDIPPISIESIPLPNPDEFKASLYSLSNQAWGTTQILSDNQRQDNSYQEDTLASDLDSSQNIVSPFSRSYIRKRANKRILIGDENQPKRLRSTMDIRLTKSYYKVPAEEKYFAKQLGGWDDFFQLKSQIATIDRDMLEHFVLETCVSHPEKKELITEMCIRSTDRLANLALRLC